MTEDAQSETSDTSVESAFILALLFNGGACMVATLVFTLLESALLSFPYRGLAGLLIGINGIAVYQFSYLWPWWRRSKKQGHPKRALGIKIAAGVTCLIVGGCWTLIGAMSRGR